MTEQPNLQLDTFPIQVTAVTPEDMKVPVTVTLTYPHGMGAYAADSLAYLKDLKGRILVEMIQQGDTSAIERGIRAGILTDAEDQTEPTTSTTQED